VIDLGDPIIKAFRARGFRLSFSQYTRKNGDLGCAFAARRGDVRLVGQSRDGNRLEALAELGRAVMKVPTSRGKQ